MLLSFMLGSDDGTCTVLMAILLSIMAQPFITYMGLLWPVGPVKWLTQGAQVSDVV